jgi:hypothetical protein
VLPGRRSITLDPTSDSICGYFTGAFAKRATEEQLIEACVCAIPHAGVAAWVPTSIGIIAGRPAK